MPPGGRLGEAWVDEGYRALLTPTRTPGVAPASFRGMPAHFSDSAQTEACYHMLSRPQPPPDPLLLQRLPRPSSLLDKTQLHSRCAACQVCRRPGQRIFPTQGSNPGLQHSRQILYQLSHQGSPANNANYLNISFSLYFFQSK